MKTHSILCAIRIFVGNKFTREIKATHVAQKKTLPRIKWEYLRGRRGRQMKKTTRTTTTTRQNKYTAPRESFLLWYKYYETTATIACYELHIPIDWWMACDTHIFKFEKFYPAPKFAKLCLPVFFSL